MVDEGPSAQAWRTSSYSLTGEACVSVAVVAQGVLIRDSKNIEEGPLVRVARDPWRLFLTELGPHGFSNTW
ncbi:DUF397 domain-containing protein [Streptomyces sp. NBC_01478]|uniref:DUF397 domain-containing protein n=1 Tax=Streptomyces sp. NBC_01478 TaxID=2903882 RepID=UPI002E376AB5|nr:DUF397 domain-containing protein [Streptomyces sp. NBC_01478]